MTVNQIRDNYAAEIDNTICLIILSLWMYLLIIEQFTLYWITEVISLNYLLEENTD